MDGNKILNGILADIKGIIPKLMKPYMKRGKIQWAKFLIEVVPLVILFFGSTYAICAFAYKRFTFTALLWSAFITFFGWMVLDDKKKNRKQFRHKEEYGSAKWGTDKDIEPFMDNVSWLNIPLTATEGLRLTRPPHPKYNRNKNMEIIGGSGSGKTRGFVKPSLMQMHTSYVVTDPKGTVLVEVGKMLRKGGYVFYDELSKQDELRDKYKGYPLDNLGRVCNKKTGKPIREPYEIKVLNTINTHKSLKYNPFVYIKTEKDILTFVDALIKNTKGEGGGGGDDFWEKAERLLYCALTALLVFEFDEEERTFENLSYLINSMETREEDEEFENAVDLLFKELETGVDEKGEPSKLFDTAKPDCFAVSQYKKYKNAAGKTAKSILISCGARLAPFDIAEIRELTSKDELELGDIGRRKTALFVIVSDTDASLNFLVSIMYTQLFNLLCTIADDEYNGPLPVHVRCILDEFANIGQIPQWDKLIATIRSREISAAMILQSKTQLKSLYKDAAEVIEGNCDTELFLGGKEKSTLKDLAEMLGKETIDTYNESDTRGTSQSYGQNYQKLGRDLMSADRIAQMDGNKCILNIRGCPSFFSDKVDITAHPMYKELSDFDPKNAFDIEKYVKGYVPHSESMLQPKPFKVKKGEKIVTFTPDMIKADNFFTKFADDWFQKNKPKAS